MHETEGRFANPDAIFLTMDPVQSKGPVRPRAENDNSMPIPEFWSLLSYLILS